jgi:membrane-associated phospholipid phosphatase
MNNNTAPLRNWLIALFICAGVVILSVAFVDHPVADWAHAHMQDGGFLDRLEHALGPLAVVVLLALGFLFGAGCWVLAGRRLGSWMELPMACSWSMVWALAATAGLKRIFGRTWPEMLNDAGTAYANTDGAFHFLRGRPGFDSFPSGSTAVAASLLAVLWIYVPRLRVAWALLLGLISVALVATNGHFVADVIAGGFLGVTVGWMTVRLLRRPA